MLIAVVVAYAVVADVLRVDYHSIFLFLFQDHMPAEEFDPKTFFALHDLDGNGFWDQDEVRVLFAKELEKVYDPDAPEDDMREREEEMERMREHVFKASN